MGMKIDDLKQKVDARQELSQEEKQKIVRTWETLKETFKEAITRVAKKLIVAFKQFVKAVREWRKKVDEEAATGNPNALYVQATLELGYWDKRLEEIEAKLKVTKQTVARKKILDQRKYIKAQVDKWKQQQIEALGNVEYANGQD